MENTYSNNSTNNTGGNENDSTVQENYDDLSMDHGEVTLPNQHYSQDNDDIIQDFIPSIN